MDVILSGAGDRYGICHHRDGMTAVCDTKTEERAIGRREFCERIAEVMNRSTQTQASEDDLALVHSQMPINISQRAYDAWQRIRASLEVGRD